MQKIWTGVINKSLTEGNVIKKDKAIVFFVLETKGKIPIKNETETKKRQPSQLYWEKKRQRGGLLNRYDFAYAGRDTVNQQVKVAPGVIKSGISEINNIAQQRINQIMHQGGQEMERVLPKILRRGIKDIYQMPFRMLGNFGKQQLQNVKNKVVK